MQAAEVRRAVAAALSIVRSLHLSADEAIMVHNSNRITLRLLPSDLLAQVAPVAHQVASFEVELAQRLTEAGCPVAAPDPRLEPRVHQRDGFVVTLWTYYEPVATPALLPARYADALQRLHAGMRMVDLATPHFTDRVSSAQQVVSSRALSPTLGNADRELLDDTLSRMRRAIGKRGGDQLLHGEPHPGNLVNTEAGVVFVDLETCCRGPVEFDLAHAPDEVSEHYPGLDQDLLQMCRVLVLAINTTWRFERGDQLPDGGRLASEWLGRIRAARESCP
jgi:hypothetical protein